MKNNNRLLYLLMVIALVWLAVLSFGKPRNVQPDNNVQINEYSVSGFATDFTKIVDENKGSIVTVMSDLATASGFVFRQDGETVYIVSAYHAVQGAAHINVLFGSSYQTGAIMIGYDEFTDLCVLAIKTPYDIRPLKMGDATLLKSGEFVISVGTPLSQEYAGSVIMGMVSDPLLSIDNTITVNGEKHNYYLDVIQLSLDTKEGYSGSPLLNMNGEVVGMNTMERDDELNFALTANEINKVANLIISGEPYERNLLDIKEIYVRDMENYEKSNLNLKIDTISGIYASKVRDFSPAYNAGIRTGDVITAINGQEIVSLDDYLEILYAPAEDFEFSVVRNGEELNLTRGND